MKSLRKPICASRGSLKDEDQLNSKSMLCFLFSLFDLIDIIRRRSIRSTRNHQVVDHRMESESSFAPIFLLLLSLLWASQAHTQQKIIHARPQNVVFVMRIPVVLTTIVS